MTNKRNKTFLLGLAVVILLPLSFYTIAKLLSKDKIDLPDYFIVEGVDTVVEDGETYYDSIYHKVQDVQLINQFGKQVSLNNDLEDKVLVVNFFFTSCPTICPKLTQHVKMLQNAFRKNKVKNTNDTIVHFVSMSIDPERDSFPAVRQYADRYNADHDHWWFLTGDRDKIYNYAHNELHVVMGAPGSGADESLHTQKLVLLDRDRHIRGYYDGLDTAELRRCADDIILLTLEKKRKHRR